MFPGTAFIYLTFCLVAFLPERSYIDKRLPHLFQRSDLSLLSWYFCPYMGTLVAHLAPVQSPEMVHQVVQVTQTLELRAEGQAGSQWG